MTGNAARLALGTAQFGSHYGIANVSGQVGKSDAARILSEARSSGIDTLDTAIAYGESETRLGSLGVEGWKIVTKVPALPAGVTDVQGWLMEMVWGSLDRLGVKRLYALLLHHPLDLGGAHGQALHRALIEAKASGMTEKIGVSVYDPAELEQLVPRFALDLVQAPFNVIDRRLKDSGWLARLSGEGIEVHTRSAFLQGLLLLPESRLPSAFTKWQEKWSEWEAWLRETSVSALRGALGFVLSNSEVDRVVVGVDGLQHLREILVASGGALSPPPESLRSDDSDLINPSRWQKS